MRFQPLSQAHPNRTERIAVVQLRNWHNFGVKRVAYVSLLLTFLNHWESLLHADITYFKLERNSLNVYWNKRYAHCSYKKKMFQADCPV